MRSARRTVLIVAVLALWALAGPLAVALADCSEMGAMCDGLCGAQAGALAPVDSTMIQPSGAVMVGIAPPLPLVAPTSLEPPPKPVRLSF